MKISVIGCGYLGAVHAAAMASLGHEVVGVDVDASRVASLAAGLPPFYEPGLPELLRSGVERGALTFSTNLREAKGAAVHFVCVGTPQRPDGPGADLTFVDAAFTALHEIVAPGDVVVGKSTVPVGTAARLAAELAEAVPGAHLVWNPEFLREGFAVGDTLSPDRVVYGVDGAAPAATEALDAVYASVLAAGTPRIVTDFATAELVKVAANSFLATKISFINAMAELCETAGGDVVALADAIGHDERIGRRFLGAGLGFGGGCLPKDIRAFVARADELGAENAVAFLREVDAINLRRRARMVEVTEEVCGGSVAGRTIGVLGAAFKPESDDVRDSPALDVAATLAARGAHVVVADPQATANAAAVRPELRYTTNALEACRDADVVLLLTEWREFRELDPDDLGAVVHGRRMVDGRNVLDPARWRGAGWTYRALGRP
ncbi:nucleotide sugar dehydrogenase [Beutenbergia cavernae DSM 12333]|uniref:UDP-glucose 6-dehydrogenase n=1 Tax=Beutenbergia cavernae (strain ATCC BAA-8 / DSM 12333 / CCUG 43141 / JCM 11478 / NBRC 16432 / NCIMB 13614 / HKI 0122) TaxID=471853 RepID=C5C081_BEUC1|nr:UDP-glucose/GDP-mannose dehydrogenase family protein [Beutenbergia cavernae]ACQ79267.1 nucleotide sugar dehydrogenase [Beutenbergia cavernae DSM 12333]